MDGARKVLLHNFDSFQTQWANYYSVSRFCEKLHLFIILVMPNENNGEIRRPQKLRQHKKSPVTNCSNKKRTNTKSPFWRIYRLELLTRATEPHVCCKKPFYVFTEFMSKEKSSNIKALTKVRWYTLSSNEKVAISQFFIYEFLLGAFIIATVPSWQYWRDSPQW